MRHLTFAIAAAAIAPMPRAVAMAPRAAAKRRGSSATTTTPTGAGGQAAADKLTGASSDDLEASGAMMEPEIRDRIDTDHPAVDNNPRAGQPAAANQIDFNDPTKTDAEAVAENLKAQGGESDR